MMDLLRGASVVKKKKKKRELPSAVAQGWLIDNRSGAFALDRL